MVALPQAFLVWEFDATESESDKLAVALIRLSSVSPCNFTPLENSQLTMWRADRRSPPLNGEYVVWTIDWYVPLDPFVTLSSDEFVGMPGLVNRARGPEVVCNYDLKQGKVRDRVGLTPVPFLRLPHAINQHLSGQSGCSTTQLVTPASYAKLCRVDVIASEEAKAEIEDTAPQRTLEAWRQRGAGWKVTMGRQHLTPLFQIECARLAMFLSSHELLDDVCKIAARIICPDLDVSDLTYPCAENVRRSMIKLDLLHMLFSRRVFLQDFRVARF